MSLCFLVLSGRTKRESRKSYFDISKYAQITKVSLSRNMMRYGHMDEYGIGTDCKVKSQKRSMVNGTRRLSVRANRDKIRSKRDSGP